MRQLQLEGELDDMRLQRDAAHERVADLERVTREVQAMVDDQSQTIKAIQEKATAEQEARASAQAVGEQSQTKRPETPPRSPLEPLQTNGQDHLAASTRGKPAQVTEQGRFVLGEMRKSIDQLNEEVQRLRAENSKLRRVEGWWACPEGWP